jgi:hypothetical protein
MPRSRRLARESGVCSLTATAIHRSDWSHTHLIVNERSHLHDPWPEPVIPSRREHEERVSREATAAT